MFLDFMGARKPLEPKFHIDKEELYKYLNSNDPENFNRLKKTIESKGINVSMSLLDDHGRSVLDCCLEQLYPMVVANTDCVQKNVLYIRLIEQSKQLLNQGAIFSLNKINVLTLYKAHDLYECLFNHPRLPVIIVYCCDSGLKTFCSNLLIRAIADRNHEFLECAEKSLDASKINALLRGYYSSTYQVQDAIWNDLTIVSQYATIHQSLDDIVSNHVMSQQDSAQLRYVGDEKQPRLSYNKYSLACSQGNINEAQLLSSLKGTRDVVHLPAPNDKCASEIILDRCFKEGVVTASDNTFLINDLKSGGLVSTRSMTKLCLLLVSELEYHELQKESLLTAIFERYQDEKGSSKSHLLGEFSVLTCLLSWSDSEDLPYSQQQYMPNFKHRLQLKKSPFFYSWIDVACYYQNHRLLNALFENLSTNDLNVSLHLSGFDDCIHFLFQRKSIQLAASVGRYADIVSQFSNINRKPLESLSSFSDPEQLASLAFVLALYYVQDKEWVQQRLLSLPQNVFRELMSLYFSHGFDFSSPLMQSLFGSPLNQALNNPDLLNASTYLQALIALQQQAPHQFSSLIHRLVAEDKINRIEKLAKQFDDHDFTLSLLAECFLAISEKSNHNCEHVKEAINQNPFLSQLIGQHIKPFLLLLKAKCSKLLSNGIEISLRYCVSEINALIDTDAELKSIVETYQLQRTIELCERQNLQNSIVSGSINEVVNLCQSVSSLDLNFTKEQVMCFCKQASEDQKHVLFEYFVSRDKAQSLIHFLDAIGVYFLTENRSKLISQMASYGEVACYLSDQESIRFCEEGGFECGVPLVPLIESR
jgi:hypothetical protein